MPEKTNNMSETVVLGQRVLRLLSQKLPNFYYKVSLSHGQKSYTIDFYELSKEDDSVRNPRHLVEFALSYAIEKEKCNIGILREILRRLNRPNDLRVNVNSLNDLTVSKVSCDASKLTVDQIVELFEQVAELL